MKTIISLLAFFFFSLSVYAQQTLTITNNSACDVFMKAGWADQTCTNNNGSTGGFDLPAGMSLSFTSPPGTRFAGAKGYTPCGPIISPFPQGGTPHQFAVGAPGFCTPCNYGLLPFASSSPPNACCQPTLTAAWLSCGNIEIN